MMPRPDLGILVAAAFLTACAPVALYEPLRPLEVRLRPGDEVFLDGSGSFDPAGSELRHQWKQVEGPKVDLLDADTPWPRFVPPEPGRYVFELVVTSAGGKGEELVSDPVRLYVDVLPPNRPPEVVLDRRLFSEPGQWVALDGGRVTDPDGDVMTFLWELVDGPPVEMRPADGCARTVFVLAREPGDYRFRLTATDVHGLSSRGELELRVRPRRQPPVAIPRLGRPRDMHLDHYPLRLTAWPHPAGGENRRPVAAAAITVDEVDGFFVVEIDATASSDPNGDELDFVWRQVGGPLVRTLYPDAEAGLAKVSFDVAAGGRYVFELVVHDGALTSEPLLVEAVLGEPDIAERTARARPEPETDGSLLAITGEDVVVELGQEFVFDGRARAAGGSRDVQALYDWRQIDGPRLTHYRMPGTATPGRLAAQPEAPGRYAFALRVSADGIRWSAPSVVTATVLAPNRAPIVVLPDQIVARPGQLVRIAAFAGDIDGDPLLAEWTAGGEAGVFGAGSTAEIVAPLSGRATVRCVVSDSRGGETVRTVEVIAADIRRPPVASVIAPAEAGVGEAVRLDATSSFDPEGEPLRFEWTAMGAEGVLRPRGGTATYRAGMPGRHILEVVAEAGGRRSSPATIELHVEPEPAWRIRHETLAARRLVEVGRPVVLYSPDAARTGARWVSDAAGDVQTADGRAVFRPEARGRYVFRLVDGDGRPVSRAVSFTAVESLPRPVAVGSVTASARIVTLDARRSRAPGRDLWFRWEQLEGPQLDLDPQPTRDALARLDAPPGEYAIRLVATDGERVARSGVHRFRITESAR